MEFKVYKKIEECRDLWDSFSPKVRLFDVWDYRECFYDKNDNEPYFIEGFEANKPIGIIPLCFARSRNQYNYFGGWFPERNSFFLKNKVKLAKLLNQCPVNTFIEGIDPSEGRYYNFLEDEYTYYLDLSKYNNDFDAYLRSLDKKKQKNLRRDLKNIPDYKIYHNRLEDFGRLVELNVRQYEEDSKFNNNIIKNGILQLMKLADKNGCLEMISLEINGIPEAVDIGIMHGDCYYAVIGGTNNQKIPNLGKLMNVLDIKNAIAKKARLVDFFATSGHWKNMWNFEKEMLLKFIK